MSKILRGIPVEKQIARHMRTWEMQRAKWQRDIAMSTATAEKTIGPYISISRTLGSHGTEIADLVAERLSWQIFDRQILEEIAGNAHVRRELVERFDEHVLSRFDTYLRNLYSGQYFDDRHYVYHLSKVLLSIAQFGRSVIVGRGANFILPREAGLQVRIVAPLPVRITKLAHDQNCAEAKAARAIEQTDEEQRSFIRHYFKSEINDPLAYDLVINSGTVPVEIAAEIILRSAEAKFGGIDKEERLPIQENKVAS